MLLIEGSDFNLSIIKLCELILVFNSKKFDVDKYTKQLSGKMLSASILGFLPFFKCEYAKINVVVATITNTKKYMRLVKVKIHLKLNVFDLIYI